MRTRIFLPFAASVLCAFPLIAQTSIPLPASTVDLAATPAQPELPFAHSRDGVSQNPPDTAPITAQQVPSPSTATDSLTPQAPAVPHILRSEGLPSDTLGSAYIPVDNWVYQAMTRLYSLGYADTMFLGLRPWTRRSVLHVLQESKDKILAGDSTEAQGILAQMLTELEAESPAVGSKRGTVYGLQSAYTRLMGVGGTTLRDSFHLGQTISNDYGRPYQTGFNSIVGFSTIGEYGRFSLHLRGEYQHAPAATGYSSSLATALSTVDQIVPYAPPNRPSATIPEGPIAAENPFRLVEASLSVHLLGHEISGGKSDAWLGPAQGGAMAWSNNAENIYSFRINRIEPLQVPLLSRFIGPLRYDFFYGSLKGHTFPNSPYVHAEAFSFRPTSNFEFGFERTIIFGGAGHAPVTLGHFLHGFFYLTDTGPVVKATREDPGARFSDFTASYRLPFMRRYMTFYVDSIAHDDVTPISAPRRAAYRTGLYLAQFPKLHKLDMRVEAVSTDPKVERSNGGQFNYFETIQRQGYTNKGIIMGDWIGREAKGGQAWLTYHLSPTEWVQLEYLNKKTPKDFVPGGTTQNQFKITVVKRIGRDVELRAWVQNERWKAPIYLPGLQTNTIGAFQVTWFPKLKVIPGSH